MIFTRNVMRCELFQTNRKILPVVLGRQRNTEGPTSRPSRKWTRNARIGPFFSIGLGQNDPTLDFREKLHGKNRTGRVIDRSRTTVTYVDGHQKTTGPFHRSGRANDPDAVWSAGTCTRRANRTKTIIFVVNELCSGSRFWMYTKRRERRYTEYV